MSTDYTTKPSRWPVAETVRRFSEAMEARGITVFAVIDQQAAAQGAGLELEAMVLMVFGNPAAGTPVMREVPLAGLDLPLKLLIWDDGGQTQVSYLTSVALGARHGLTPTLLAPLCGIDALTDGVLGG